MDLMVYTLEEDPLSLKEVISSLDAEMDSLEFNET